MALSPEERRKIYEEEKARIEAREHLEREKKSASADTTTGLQPNIASLLCYVGGWVTGIIFFVIEQKNVTVRFHAAQSIITFGSLTVIISLLDHIPFIGNVFSALFGITAFILWIVLMVKAHNGEVFRLGVVAEIADRMVGAGPVPKESVDEPTQPVTEPVSESVSDPVVPPEPVKVPQVNLDKEIGRKIEEYFNRKRSGRIAGSAFTVAFSITALIFFNYFNDYVAFYSSDTVNGVLTWTRTPFFTDDISLWLPVFTTAMVASIIGHFIAILFDRYILREIIMVIIDVFALGSVITLATVFPFDFYVIPDASVAEAVEIAIRVILWFVSVGIGIGILVKIIKFLVNLVKGHVSYDTAA